MNVDKMKYVSFVRVEGWAKTQGDEGTDLSYFFSDAITKADFLKKCGELFDELQNDERGTIIVERAMTEKENLTPELIRQRVKEYIYKYDSVTMLRISIDLGFDTSLVMTALSELKKTDEIAYYHDSYHPKQ